MTAQQLKNSILQMAVSGKLVPQDPNDEPASVLLKRIKSEKQELIKAGKIKKDKKSSEIFRGTSRNIPYTFCEQIGKEIRDISDEIPFDIPESWEWVRFSTIMELQSGQDLTFDKYNSNKLGLPYITGASNIVKGTIIINRWTEYGRSFAYKGDILLTCKGTVGEIALLQQEQVHIARQLIAIHLYKGTSTDYIELVLKTLVEKLKAAAKSMIPGIARNDVLQSLIPLPPLPEQHRIVNKIKELLPYIYKYEQAENQLTKLNNDFPELLKKSILQEAVQGKLVPQDPNDEPASVLLERIRAEKQTLIKASKIKKDKHESVIVTRDKIPYEIVDGKERCIADEVPFEIPESWEWVRLKDIGIYKKGPFGSSLTKSMFVSKGNDTIKVYEQKNAIKKDHTLGNYYITREYYEEKMQGFTVNPGDIIVSCAGTIGETYVMPNNIELGIINQALMKMTIFAPIDIDYFLMYFDYILKALAKEHSKGSAIKNIPPFDIFKNLLLPLPPIEEQHRIVAKIEELMKYCEML